MFTVAEGSSITVFVNADRQFQNGPFFLTVRSLDNTAQCMLSCSQLNHANHYCALSVTASGQFPDYNAIDQALTLSVGQPVQSVTITANADQFSEPNEQFFLQLLDTATLTILFNATVIITDVSDGMSSFV